MSYQLSEMRLDIKVSVRIVATKAQAKYAAVM
jgi:hypothetical protein